MVDVAWSRYRERVEDYERVCIRLGNSKLREIVGGLRDGGCRLESVQGECRFEAKSVCWRRGGTKIYSV